MTYYTSDHPVLHRPPVAPEMWTALVRAIATQPDADMLLDALGIDTPTLPEPTRKAGRALPRHGGGTRAVV